MSVDEEQQLSVTGGAREYLESVVGEQISWRGHTCPVVDEGRIRKWQALGCETERLELCNEYLHRRLFRADRARGAHQLFQEEKRFLGMGGNRVVELVQHVVLMV